MELLTPGFGLIVWQTVVIINIVLFFVAMAAIVRTKTLTRNERVAWLLITFWLPVFGPIIFLLKDLKSKRFLKKTEKQR